MDNVIHLDMPLSNRIFAEVVYSPDDSGWYFSIYNRDGETLHRGNNIYDSEKDVRQAVRTWYKNNFM